MKRRSFIFLPSRRTAASLAAITLLAGCASFSKDGGFDAVGEAVKARTGETPTWVRSDAQAQTVAAEVNKRLAEPLGPEDAVRIALLNNRGLQAAYASLGIAESELVQAGRWTNPVFSLGRLTRGDELEIERAFIFNLMSLFTMPRRVEIAEGRFEQAKLAAAGEALSVAHDARRAWFEAVAAREAAGYFEQVMSAAEAGAELARRMAAVGNFSKLQRMREQAFYADAVAQLARARQAALATREKLARVLGVLEGESMLKLPARLPQLPAAPRETTPLEAAALRERLDVQSAKREAEALAAMLGLTGATRFVNVLELKTVYNTESPKPPQKGLEVELSLPIFDTGDARLTGAQHRYMQAVHRTAQLAVNARSEVREAYGAYRTAWDLARHYRDEIVPLRKRISEENLLRYNGMLIGVFELLADARQTVGSVATAINAQRDFWIAEGALQLAVTGRSPGAMAMGPAEAAPAGGAGAGH